MRCCKVNQFSITLLNFLKMSNDKVLKFGNKIAKFINNSFCLFNALDEINQFCSSVCLLMDRLSNNYLGNSLLILTKFCILVQNMGGSMPIVCGANRSSNWILEVHKFRNWQCSDTMFVNIWV